MFPETITREEEPAQTLRLMTTASTPATPGPSTPTALRTIPLEQLKVIDDEDEGIVLPARPCSTPFPRQEALEGDIQCIPRANDLSPIGAANILKRRYDVGHQSDPYKPHTSHPPLPVSTSSPLCDLPMEIHERILDYLFGFRNSASVIAKRRLGESKVLRNWSNQLRHARRREVSDLALVSEQWRHLVQDRLYRHIKIKATRESVDQASLWFSRNSRLCPYIKHIEFWFPVFESKPLNDRSLRMPLTTTRPSIGTAGTTFGLAEEGANPLVYQAPHNNCSIEEVFRFAQMTFGKACVLTLEGGDRKKPPKVRNFLEHLPSQILPALVTIKTLVCKGQWNLIRGLDDFQHIVAALPNLTEWHGCYAKPKSKSYLSMAKILPNLPLHLTNVNLCLENDFRREAVTPAFFRKVALSAHFCVEMAKAMPALEHFQYTGRVCRSFFDTAATLSDVRTSRLRSIELIVKNICRPSFQWSDGSGITDMGFIHAFEVLVHSGIRALDRLPALELLKIKFIDLGKFLQFVKCRLILIWLLESLVPSWNPYFQLEDNKCTGIWSDQIIDTLARTRPGAAYFDRSDASGEPSCVKDGQFPSTPHFLKTRPQTIKVSSYLSLSGGITIT